MNHGIVRPTLGVAIATLAAFVALALPAASAGAASCADGVGASDFATAAQLKKLTRKFNSFGPRILGSAAHHKSIDRLKGQAKKIDGMEVSQKPFKPYTWLPRTHFTGSEPGLDIGGAGGLSVTRPNGSTVDVEDAGAVHWSDPAAEGNAEGPLVYLPPDQEITPENSAGNVVVRDFELGTLPFGGVGAVLGLYLTPDIEDYGDYTRPYLSPNVHTDLVAAGQAGAAGVVYAFDLPSEDVRGYYDPHQGELYRVPAVFVGRSEGEQLKDLAAQGSSAGVTVDARVARKKTRNVIADLPGRSSEKIVLAANTDGNSWVQENGVIGMLAFARYYADLPMRCRPRTLELVFSSAHDGFRNDGLTHYDATDEDIAFAYAIEHLGTREILPTGEGADRHLEFTGFADPALFGAGDSEALREAAVAATKKRDLPRTAVLKGLAVPNPAYAPSICSMGGLGNFFHLSLVPTLAMISGPWSLYDPVFGAKAIDFGQMRSQMLAAGDTILTLDGLPRAEIAGDYPALKAELEAGTRSACPVEEFPQFAPGPGT
jgi:hypothetical protein